ncbi:MAG: acyl-CoA dehydratase activase [Spirochaetaceae bacterium]
MDKSVYLLGKGYTMILGIDIGSVMVSVASVDRTGKVLQTRYEAHYGQARSATAKLLKEISLQGVEAVACTAGTPRFVVTENRYNETVCSIRAARAFHSALGALLSVGGERFFLVRFDEEGEYRSVHGNTSCAAGTGAFLDQQALRLGLTGSAELSALALQNREARPAIASRCSVFAKTDLIHAQQEGYGLPAICDGLCHGLARNLVDTLASGAPVREPVVFAGGVALNRRVVEHVRELLGKELLIDEYASVYGALGATLEYLQQESRRREDEEGPQRAANGSSEELIEAILGEERQERSYHFPPLRSPSSFPDFTTLLRYDHSWPGRENNPVETDLYREVSGRTECYLGIDIGSTSTKAVLLRRDGEVVAAFYTRTAGRPIPACQALFRTIRDLEERVGGSFEIIGMGTTGSGRKFAGSVFGADLVLDEITAHAKAAYELDPEVDTIVEIGGQDAKFTTLREGRVTFSQMNSVCAAGTGSFIEEQAGKLDVPLSEFADLALGAPSPLASDRCTVFMERDINYYLNQEYDVPEILAATLHSVRENYLQKVAVAGAIGRRICFQGATAKNRALIASFEQKLGKPIFVSKFCHVTGAMGVALLLREEQPSLSAFRGLDVYKQEIAVRSERCTLCANQCRLRLAEVGGRTVAFGFLCGRDYETNRYIPPKSEGFDLLSFRKRVFRETRPATPVSVSPGERTVGLPRALHLTSDLPFWRTFFQELGIPVVEEEPSREVLSEGKELQQAEFCAPMTNLHGQVARLLARAEYVFLPMYIGEAEEHGYCYYTQFSAPVLRSLVGPDREKALITPALGPVGPSERIRSGQGHLPWVAIEELTRALKPLSPTLNLLQVRSAYSVARDHVSAARQLLVSEFLSRRRGAQEQISVVLTGRPYTVLDPVMNKGIPRIVAQQGVDAFYHDMLPDWPGKEYEPLLTETAWRYAQDILATARYCAFTEGVYPVLVTSFKCSPDSFVIEFFTQILEERGKPYLILQVDEHDSSVGYETRIEAGIRAFRNHYRSESGAHSKLSTPSRSGGDLSNRPLWRRFADTAPLSSLMSRWKSEEEVGLTKELGERTLLLPNWDPITTPLLAANLQSLGIDARMLEETPESIRASMRLNSGQCVPISIMTQEVLETIERERLAAEKTAVWMPKSGWACNLAMYPHFLKRLLEREGAGEVSVFAGAFTYADISPQATVNGYFAYLFGGLLRRVGCIIRPYEIIPGATDRAIKRSVELLREAFLGNGSREERVDEALSLFDEIPRAGEQRPKVAIFGDLYVRDNDIFNQGLINTIEEAGGEVITTPYSDYTKIIAGAHFRRLRRQGKFGNWAFYRTILALVEYMESRYYERFERWVGPRISSRDDELEEKLGAFGVHLDHSGESVDNVLKIFRLLEEHPDLSLFVQASPAFCCPSLITEAMAEKIRQVTGVPVVSVTYDGTGSPKNEMIVPYLRFARRSAAQKR